jgi:hypothetical protein
MPRRNRFDGRCGSNGAIIGDSQLVFLSDRLDANMRQILCKRWDKRRDISAAFEHVPDSVSQIRARQPPAR